MDMELVDDATQVWRWQADELPMEESLSLELRVGGMLWRQVARDPQKGEWAIIEVPWYPGRAVQLGSVTLGWPVECHLADSHGDWHTLNEECNGDGVRRIAGPSRHTK